MRKLYNGDASPSLLFQSNTSPVTLFTEIVSPNEQETVPSYMVQPYPQALQLPPPTSMKRSFSQTQSYPSYPTGLGMVPPFMPSRRRRIASKFLHLT